MFQIYLVIFQLFSWHFYSKDRLSTSPTTKGLFGRCVAWTFSNIWEWTSMNLLTFSTSRLACPFKGCPKAWRSSHSPLNISFSSQLESDVVFVGLFLSLFFLANTNFICPTFLSNTACWSEEWERKHRAWNLHVEACGEIEGKLSDNKIRLYPMESNIDRNSRGWTNIHQISSYEWRESI